VINLAFVGACKDSRIRDMVNELERRIRVLWNLSVEEIPSDSRSILTWLEKHKAKGQIVSMDPLGEAMDSQAFGRWITASSRDLYLVVWGAEGPPDAVKLSLPNKFSLSKMTYSHELARLMLMEQVYRAACSLKGHPYPK